MRKEKHTYVTASCFLVAHRTRSWIVHPTSKRSKE